MDNARMSTLDMLENQTTRLKKSMYETYIGRTISVRRARNADRIASASIPELDIEEGDPIEMYAVAFKLLKNEDGDVLPAKDQKKREMFVPIWSLNSKTDSSYYVNRPVMLTFRNRQLNDDAIASMKKKIEDYYAVGNAADMKRLYGLKFVDADGNEVETAGELKDAKHKKLVTAALENRRWDTSLSSVMPYELSYEERMDYMQSIGMKVSV